MVRIIFGVALFICLSGTNLGEGDDERSSSELVEQPEKEKKWNKILWTRMFLKIKTISNDRPGGSFGTLNFIWNLILRPEMIP